MKKSTSDRLHGRIAELKGRLRERLEGNASAEELEGLMREVDVLRRLERLNWRHRSIAWVGGGVATAILLAVLLHWWPRKQADIVLGASARAFTVANGPASNAMLPSAIRAHGVGAYIGTVQHAWCVDQSLKSSFGSCEPVRNLHLNRIALNANAAAEVRVSGSCFRVQILKGAGQSDITFWRSSLRPEVLAQISKIEFASFQLTEGDWVLFCPEVDEEIRLKGSASMVIGERTYGGEPQNDPSLTQGSLQVVDTARLIEFRRGDVPWVGGISRGSLIARLHNPIEITFAGTAMRIGVGEKSIMPTWLDWVRSNPDFKATLAILSAIIGAAIAIRQRIMDEIS